MMTMTEIRLGMRVRVRADAMKATGCVPEGAPHVHAGTCEEIIATTPYLWRDLYAGQVGRVVARYRNPEAVGVAFEGGAFDEYAPEHLEPVA